MDAVTICAVNYLPFAHLLGKSFLEHNQDSTFSIFVIDSAKTPFTKNDQFNYLEPASLNISSEKFQNMAFYYNVTELATALKPSVLKVLFNLGCEKVIYLDPDIEIFDELSELNETLNTESIVLTPHTLGPIPRDGFRPDEADILGSGTFNLGFLGLRKNKISSDFLDWWEERLEFDSISDPTEMLFTDQRWIDLVPSYFPFFTLRHPGYNVAYWNLHERKLTRVNNSIMVNDQPLKFFHFSGYKPNKPWILSKYVSDRPRVVISQDQLLKEICKWYGTKAVQNGWTESFEIKYGFNNFENGKIIPSSLRRLYREDCMKASKNGEHLKPPVDWIKWATDRSKESGNLSRILFSIWKSRPDLMRRYPDATGSESKDLVNWAKIHGQRENVIDLEFLEIGNLEYDRYPTQFKREMGINIAGYLNGEFGLGQSARNIYEAALVTDLPISLLNSNRSESKQSEIFKGASAGDYYYPVTIAVVNADHFKFWVGDVGKAIMKNTAIIGVWAWETEDFPLSMHAAFEYVDEIWAVSKFVKTALEKHTKKPIYVYPAQIQQPQFIEKLDRSAVNLEIDETYNLFIFDFSSVFNRKNPIGLIHAHKKAFPNSDGPTLVIKSINGDRDAENRERLRYEAQGRSDIKLIENHLTKNQVTALLNECSNYISLHRSEGYGLTISEALSLGKSVIATGYSGNTDFMKEGKNCYLINFNKIPIGIDSFPYNSNSMWADPDLNQAAEIMVQLYLNSKVEINSVHKINNFYTAEFNLESATQFIAERVRYNSLLRVRLKRIILRKIKTINSILKMMLLNLRSLSRN